MEPQLQRLYQMPEQLSEKGAYFFKEGDPDATGLSIDLRHGIAKKRINFMMQMLPEIQRSRALHHDDYLSVMKLIRDQTHLGVTHFSPWMGDIPAAWRFNRKLDYFWYHAMEGQYRIDHQDAENLETSYYALEGIVKHAFEEKNIDEIMKNAKNGFQKLAKVHEKALEYLIKKTDSTEINGLLTAARREGYQNLVDKYAQNTPLQAVENERRKV